MDKRYDKKILFFDVDDTLVDSKTGKVPESTIEALHNLQENGHKICISTGRPLFNKANPSIFFDVPWDGYVCFNGQGIYNKERVMFYNYAYSKDVVRRLIEKVNEQKYNMMLLEEKRTVMAMQKRHVNIFIWICHHMKNIREMIFLEWLCVLRVDVIYLCLRI